MRCEGKGREGKGREGKGRERKGSSPAANVFMYMVIVIKTSFHCTLKYESFPRILVEIFNLRFSV